MTSKIAGQSQESAEPCRQVTAEEIAHYREHGWVKLDKLVAPAVIQGLLDMAHEAFGKDGLLGASEKGAGVPPFRTYRSKDVKERFRPMLEGLGSNARALMARGGDARHFDNQFLAKLPSAYEDKLFGAARTDFHQEFSEFQLDRTGSMVIWLALTDLEPEAGTMSFLDRSHRRGPLGSMKSEVKDGRILLDIYPELLEEYPPTPPFRYRAGDATVHHDLCIHGAGQNLTDQPRIAHVSLFVPDDARWNGGPSQRIAESGVADMKAWDRLSDAAFPIMGAGRPD